MGMNPRDAPGVGFSFAGGAVWFQCARRRQTDHVQQNLSPSHYHAGTSSCFRTTRKKQKKSQLVEKKKTNRRQKKTHFTVSAV